MANVKRPALRKNDRVTLSPIKSVIPAYDGKPFVLRDTVLTVSHLEGTGSKRNPWHVVVTDGTHFWHLEPDDVMPAETKAAHSTKKRSTRTAGSSFGSKSIVVGDLVARIEAPTVLYRITEKFPAYLRALPYRRSGPEKILLALKPGSALLRYAGLIGDGSQWIVVGHD